MHPAELEMLAKTEANTRSKLEPHHVERNLSAAPYVTEFLGNGDESRSNKLSTLSIVLSIAIKAVGNHIDLLYQRRVDPAVPMEDVAGKIFWVFRTQSRF